MRVLEKYLQKLIDLAETSDTNHMHSAIIFNGKTSFYGVSSNRTRFGKSNMPSLHAEVDAINKFNANNNHNKFTKGHNYSNRFTRLDGNLQCIL